MMGAISVVQLLEFIPSFSNATTPKKNNGLQSENKSAWTKFSEVVMRLPKHTILTSSCLSVFITLGAMYPAIAAPENEEVAQRQRIRASGGANQIEIVGYVKGIIGCDSFGRNLN